MTRRQLATLCRAIWADDWVSPLARCLGVNIRTAQRWAAGSTPVPDWVPTARELARATAQAHDVLQARIRTLVDHLAGATHA